MQDPSAETTKEQIVSELKPPHTTTLVAMIDKRWRPIEYIVILFHLKYKEIMKEHDELRNSNRAKRILSALKKSENQDILEAILDYPIFQGTKGEEIDYTIGVIQRLEKMASYTETPPIFGGEEAKAAYNDNSASNAWKRLRQDSQSRRPLQTMYQIHTNGVKPSQRKKKK